MSDQRGVDRDLLLQAALDGELDAAGMVAFEARLAADAALAADYARLIALREAIRARAPRPKAPEALRARVSAMAQGPGARPEARRPSHLSQRYAALAASLVFGVAIGAGAIDLLAPPRDDEAVVAVVGGYVRGRLAAQPVDVVSSDRHTVKPWLAGKVAGAATVLDLKADGFPLVGGRVDVVGATPVATLVYQRREHQIALSELPAAAGTRSAPLATARDGYGVLEWSDRGRRYIAVSDLPPAELEAFGADFRRAAEAEREEPAKP